MRFEGYFEDSINRITDGLDLRCERKKKKGDLKVLDFTRGGKTVVRAVG